MQARAEERWSVSLSRRFALDFYSVSSCCINFTIISGASAIESTALLDASHQWALTTPEAEMIEEALAEVM